ncbi:MAG: hypothetical protein JWO80_3248 [Bryobacterales bacterium]|nr:hypothetical protein [Bryobacterales bacterium]
MGMGQHIREITRTPYYRRSPLETLRYTYAKFCFSRYRLDSPEQFLKSLGLEPELALSGFEKWRSLLEGVVHSVRTRDAEGAHGGVSMEDGTILYGITRAIRPQHVIETGVAAGVSNAFLSAALIENGTGFLHSIELPPVLTAHTVMQDGSSYKWDATGVGWAIPPQIREAIAPRHSLILEDVKTALPRLLDSLPMVDLFFHDDLHTPDHMLWEYELVWPRLRPGGVLLSDDADYGWLRFCRHFSLGRDRFQNIQRLTGARKP